MLRALPPPRPTFPAPRSSRGSEVPGPRARAAAHSTIVLDRPHVADVIDTDVIDTDVIDLRSVASIDLRDGTSGSQAPRPLAAPLPGSAFEPDPDTDADTEDFDTDGDQRLWWSINGLREAQPEMSAAREPSRRARRLTRGLLLALVLTFLIRPMLTAIVLSSVVTVGYLLALGYKTLLFRQGLRGGGLLVVSEEQALAMPDDQLPTITILVPVYKEPESMAQLLQALGDMDYPADRLEVRVLLEADDTVTIEALAAANPAPYVEAVVVPPAEPRTKPKACNYGVIGARGDYIVIYDAEDQPEPFQLRRAAYCFAHVPDDVVCIQAKLGFYNPRQNRITKWFTLDYGTWFNLLLPGLVGMGAPVPLGGTSNFFRRETIEELGAWDPYNVTEDADLGLRLARAGYRTLVLDSTTGEEANSDLINWVKQRSRWYKGYLQTALVHLRQPRRTYRELGWRGFAGLVLFVGGTPLLAVMNPFNWAMTLLWLASKPTTVKKLFPGPVYYMAFVCLIAGNLTTIYQGLIACRVTKNPDLAVNALMMPLYWLMMSMAAIKALWQLVLNPFHWEKTQHGLHHSPGSKEPSALKQGRALDTQLAMATTLTAAPANDP
jgi:glycosyltransferase XagB